MGSSASNQKNKVVRLHHKTVVKALKDMLELAQNGKLRSIVMAGNVREKGGEELTYTSWANAEPGHRMELIGHLQIDVMMDVVAVNLIE